jgi:hypothetical protein
MVSREDLEGDGSDLFQGGIRAYVLEVLRENPIQGICKLAETQRYPCVNLLVRVSWFIMSPLYYAVSVTGDTDVEYMER